MVEVIDARGDCAVVVERPDERAVDLDRASGAGAQREVGSLDGLLEELRAARVKAGRE